MNLKQYQQLKDRVDTLRQNVARAEGVRDELLKRLRREYGCETVEEAEQLHLRLASEAEEAEGRFQQQLAQFNEEWGDLLDG